MMSEVEQDAVEQLKKLLHDFDNEDISETDLWVINRLIEKQQKEIEEYKKLVECIEEFKRLKRPVMELVHEMNKFEDEFISKNKIIEKIKELENKNHYYIDEKGKHIKTPEDYKISVLKELLKE